MSSLTSTRRTATLIGLLLCLLTSSGCQVLQHPATLEGGINCAEGTLKPWVPRELDKATVPMYRVEPPDILAIEVVQQISPSTYTLQESDTVLLSVEGTFADEPISGEYPVAAGGVLELGHTYGAVEVAGRTIDDALVVLDAHLRHQLRDPKVSMSLRNVANTQHIAGEYMVVSDGTISLGPYGSVPVVGMTLDEIRQAITAHLSDHFTNPLVSVSVFAFNSKAYYVVTQGGGMGDNLARFPCTGNETVMDALSQINGLSYVSSSQMWIARPDRNHGSSQILPIDWEAITQRAEVDTNYQLLPGDRLYIAHNRLVAFDLAIAKLTSPFERIFGFTLLGTGTTARLSGKVLRNNDISYLTPLR